RKLGQTSEAALILQETVKLDRLDWWSRHLDGQKLTCDLQTQLDIAHDYARAGFYDEAIELLSASEVAQVSKPAVSPISNRQRVERDERLRTVVRSAGWKPCDTAG